MKNPLRWLVPARTGVVETTKSQDVSSLFAVSHGGHAHWSSADYATMARRGFMANPVVYRCVRLICENAAAVPLLLYDGAQELDSHPALDLVTRPNQQMGRSDFVEGLVGHLLISGNAYVELLALEGTPRELHLLRPDRVSAITGENGWVEGFEYRAGNRSVTYRADAQGRMPVAQLRLFHPLDDLTGFPPLQAALMALDIHNAASRWNKALLDNSARPSGALVYANAASSNLSEDQFARLKSELEDGYSGASRAGRPLLLEGGLDWKAMGLSPKDMDFVEARNSAARDIALAFGVPPMLLGIPGDNTYSNYAEANRAFARQTLIPMLVRTLDGLNHWLRQWFDPDIRLAIDEDRIEGLGQEREAVWARLANADFLTDAEKREALGYSPQPEGHDV